MGNERTFLCFLARNTKNWTHIEDIVSILRPSACFISETA
jgi:hypothetical protein